MPIPAELAVIPHCDLGERFNVELVEDQLRRPVHAPTVGLLLCTDTNDRVVWYALATSSQPIAIASYDLLPPEQQAALPSEADLNRAALGKP